MDVSEALIKRSSIRAFLPNPIPQETLDKILTTAMLAPSGCNVQPWQVYIASGQTRDNLQESLLAEATSGKTPYPDLPWLTSFEGIYKQRQYAAAAALYETLGIERSNRDARSQALLRNWAFFDAPHVAFFTVDRSLGYTAVADLGIFAQSVALLLTEAGLGCCLQAALNQFPGPIREQLHIPDNLAIAFGMSFGYADPHAPVNQTTTQRESINNLVKFFN